MRYDHYELKAAEDGKRYITPGKNAKPDVYNPLKEVPNIVLDALNVGMLMMGRKPEAEVEKAVMEFITRYGLLGLMTALPTTPSFMDYEAVYLPKNHFIKEESMATDKYLSLFYPFDQLDVVKKGIESTWNVSGDRTMIALTMTFMDEPMAKNMSFQREYAEPYDWVAQQFKDWAFTLTTAFFYYNDYAFMGEDERGLHRKAMAAFGGIAPSIQRLTRPAFAFHQVRRAASNTDGNCGAFLIRRLDLPNRIQNFKPLLRRLPDMLFVRHHQELPAAEPFQEPVHALAPGAQGCLHIGRDARILAAVGVAHQLLTVVEPDDRRHRVILIKSLLDILVVCIIYKIQDSAVLRLGAVDRIFQLLQHHVGPLAVEDAGQGIGIQEPDNIIAQAGLAPCRPRLERFIDPYNIPGFPHNRHRHRKIPETLIFRPGKNLLRALDSRGDMRPEQ